MTARAGREGRGRGDGALDDGRKQAEAGHVSNHDDKSRIVRLHASGPFQAVSSITERTDTISERSVRQDAPKR